MKGFLLRWYYRSIDRSLVDPVKLGDRSEMESGEWNRLVGSIGEDLASKFLRSEGKKVLYRNYRAPGGGEVDIVFRDGDTLVFCEVKTRTSEQFGRPGRAVDRDKQALIIRGANAWLRELMLPDVLFRFDVVEILLSDGEIPEIRLNQNVFNSSQSGLGM